MLKGVTFFLGIIAVLFMAGCSANTQGSKKDLTNNAVEEPFRSGERTDYNPTNAIFSSPKHKTRYCTYHDDSGFAYEAPCGKP